jgi:hypothetical protein
MSTLWRGHPATPAQQSLCFEPEAKKKPARKRSGYRTEADVLLEMLRAARAVGKPLELPTIMQAGIAQHGARMTELRERGFEIVNEMERCDRAVRSWYRLVFDPERETR